MTRHHLLTRCERAAFWWYFGCRGAGLPDGDPDAGRAWALRHLTELPLLVGIVVHAAARTVVTALCEGTRLPTYATLLRAARFTLNQVWRTSQPDQIDLFWRYPGAFTALREVALRGNLREGEIAVARARVRSCLAALLQAPVLDDLRGCRREDIVLPKDDGPVDFAPFDGALAWGAVDVAYRHQDVRTVTAALAAAAHETTDDLPPWRNGPAERLAARRASQRVPRSEVWTIADWKTGASANPDAELLQLATLAIWLESAGYPRTDGVFLGRIVDLVHRADRWYVLDDEAMAAARAVIAADLERQRGLMSDSAAAVPQPKTAWALAADRRRCPACRFHPLCRGELAEGAPRLRSDLSGAD